MLIMMPVQMFIYVVYPPPTTVIEHFTLLGDNWLLGLLSLDLLYIINNAILIPIYLSVYYALRKDNEPLMTIALVIGLVGVTTYFASNTSFEMLTLSRQFTQAATQAERNIYLAAGQSMWAIYKGTAFNVYYILNAIVLILYSLVMLKSNTFNRFTAYIGLLTGLMMSVPTTAGTLGMVLGIASLIPWAVWLILIIKRFSNIK